MYKGLLDSVYWIDEYDNGEMRLIRPVFKYFLYQKCTIVSQSKRQREKGCITVITGQSNTLILSMRSTPS